MSVSSTRVLNLQYSGDMIAGFEVSAAVNAASPGVASIQDLASGNNTITVPTGGNSIPTAVTIVPPAENEEALTLKGVNGDTGILLHETDPFTLSLAPTVTTFVIHAGAAIEGVRFYWS